MLGVLDALVKEFGVEHILERHAFGSPAANAGKFARDVDIPQLTKDAVDTDGTTC
jgi:hypothetical protein